MTHLYLSKFTGPNSNEITYCGDNIKISVKDRIINNIFVFIPSDLNIPHVFMIYKIITGIMPGEYAPMDLYPYEMLTKLESCYPCVEEIHRSELYNPRICPSSIVVGYDKNGIRISVIYGEYDKCDKYDTMQVYSNGDKRIRDAVGKVFGYNWTNDLCKELRTKFDNKGDNNMKYPETAYISNDMEINIKKRVINNITVYIPLYCLSVDAVKIYDIITGHGELRPYEMITELEKYYPYLKNIDKNEIDIDSIYISEIGVFYEDTRARIVVEYNKYSKSVACHIDDKRVDLINIFTIGKGTNIAKNRFYSWRDINIHVTDGVIDLLKLYIPTDLDQIDICNIYDIITGYIPDGELINEERSIIVDKKGAIKKMYFYDLLDELKKYYSSLREVHRTEIYNTPIYPKDIDVLYSDKTIAITIKYGYTTTSFSIPNLSEIYSAITSERYDIYRHLLLTTGKVTFKFDWENTRKLYGISKDIAEEVLPKKNNKAPDDYTRQGRDIKIHASHGTIDKIKLRVPVVAHAGILDNINALQIYDIVTGYTPITQFVAEEKTIKIDEGKYIKKVQSYDLLDKLKKYYPCLEGMHRNKLFDDQLYPTDVNVCNVDNAVIITVKYGYAVTLGSFARPKLYEIYAAVSSGQAKLFNHLSYIPNKSDEKLKKIEKIKKEINSIFGAPVNLKEFEKKYVETRPSTENDSKEKATIVVTSSFDAITDELKDTYIKKNHDYGNSFDKSIDKFGLTAAVVRMNDKMERLSSLMNKDAKVDESIRDTVMDLANYCIMTAMYLDNKEEKK